MADFVSTPIPDVLSELQTGDGLSLSAVGRLFPGHRGGASVDPSTVFRWVTKGTRTPSGTVVKLEAVRVGGRWITSRQAVARFVTALTENVNPNPASHKSNTSANPDCQHKAASKAAAVLKAMGA